MRRLYVMPHRVVDEFFQQQAGGSFGFHPRVGFHWMLLHPTKTHGNQAEPEDMVLLSTSFDHSEQHEDAFHSHPEVAVLPHPSFEGNDKLNQHKDSPTKKIKKQHLDALAVIGVNPATHTVMDVSRIASALVPEVKLRHIL